MGSDEGAEDALAAAESTLAAIEGVNLLADAAQSMKNALETRGFGSAISDRAGVDFMFAMLATSQPAPTGGKSKR